MNIQLSKNTIDLLAKCTEQDAALKAFETESDSQMKAVEYTRLFETLSSNARMLAMSLQADKEMMK